MRAKKQDETHPKNPPAEEPPIKNRKRMGWRPTALGPRSFATERREAQASGSGTERLARGLVGWDGTPCLPGARRIAWFPSR